MFRFSPLQFSDAHTKLVWTLNYSLIEWTSKFVPQCHLLSNTIIAASNFLKKTHNEDLYLCVLHVSSRYICPYASGRACVMVQADVIDALVNLAIVAIDGPKRSSIALTKSRPPHAPLAFPRGTLACLLPRQRPRRA